jgi:Lon protease-like protein
MAGPPSYHRIGDLPNRLAVFPLSRAILLPRGRLPLNIFEPRYLTMIDDAMAGNRLIGMIQPTEPEDSVERPGLYGVGCVGRITSYSETGDGRYRITLTGICRFRAAEELPAVTPYRQLRLDYEPFAADLVPPQEAEDEEGRARLLAALKQYLERNALAADWGSIERAPNETLINALSMISPFSVQEKQALLESPTIEDRRQVLTALIEMALAGSSEGGGPVQ